ncbi:MAG: hypothetical protein QOG31_1082 [Thermoplasmata archaeon]|nr:hypothetical protein [Thermoplasmata archaeon]
MALLTVPVLPAVHADPVPVVPQDVQDFLLGQVAFAMKLAQDPTHANETLQAQAQAISAFVLQQAGLQPPTIPPTPDAVQHIVCNVLKTVVISLPDGEVNPGNLLFHCSSEVGGLIGYICGGWVNAANFQLPSFRNYRDGTEVRTGGVGPNTDGLMVTYFAYYGTLRRGYCV